MKKFLLILMVAGICLTSVFASPLTNLKNGEFAYYTDTRQNKLFARGYMVIHAGDFSLIYNRIINMKTNEEYNFVFRASVEMIEDKPVAKVLGVQANEIIENSPDKMFILQSIADFMNCQNMYMSCVDKIEYDTRLDDPWDTFTLVYHFNKILPMFQIYDIEIKGSGKYFELNSYGQTNFNSPDPFEKFFTKEIYLPEKKSLEDFEIPVGKKQTVKMDKIKLTLDDNWVEGENNGFPSYFLAIGSERDAQISVEKFPTPLKDKDQRFLFVKQVVSIMDDIIPSSIKVTEDKSSICLEVLSLDSENFCTYSRYRITDKYIINFSCFENVWVKHNEYLTKILDSVKIR